MLSYNHYKLIEDLNKKLFLYKNTYVEEKEYFFNDSKMYDIALKLKNNSKSNNSFSYEDIIPISSELWKLLLKSNNCYTEVFKEWLEIVKNNFKYLDNIKVQFEDDISKSIFLDEALNYILNAKELIQTWEDNYKQLFNNLFVLKKLFSLFSRNVSCFIIKNIKLPYKLKLFINKILLLFL